MANNLYTTKTAALKATKADVSKLNVKTIKVNGKNIEELWGLNLPQDYPKLISRTQLFENDNYALYDDQGNLLFMNFSDKIVNGSNMFYQKNINSFNYDLPNLTNGSNMFQGTNLESFNSDLSSLTNGTNMFYDCTALNSFTSNLSTLTNGYWMFHDCSNLTTFNCDNLSRLTNGEGMFKDCSNLTTFNCESLTSLTDGNCMFCNTNLKSFNVDLSSVTDGYLMFAGCSNLESFSSKLSSLSDGDNMFSGCNLDYASIENIFSSIPTYTSGQHDLDVEVQQSGANKIQEITGLTPSQDWQSTNYKGWEVSFKIKS